MVVAEMVTDHSENALLLHVPVTLRQEKMADPNNQFTPTTAVAHFAIATRNGIRTMIPDINIEPLSAVYSCPFTHLRRLLPHAGRS